MAEIFSFRRGKMGKAMVKYGEPIDLDQYVNNFYSSSGATTRPVPNKSDDLALQLTRDLVYQQYKMSPMT